MTPQRAKELIPVLTAIASGEPVQAKFNDRIDTWDDQPAEVFGLDKNLDWRVKPKPATRPWSKPEDVPGPVCWVRKAGLEGFASLVIGVTPDGCRFIRSDDEPISRVDWEEFEEREHSTDRKTWFPCTVPEEQP